MKRTFNLLIILSLFSQISFAQKIETIEEYKVFYDRIVSLVKVVEKDSNSNPGKPFSEYVKYLDKYGIKIIRVVLSNCDCEKVSPQHLYGISLRFTTNEYASFALFYDLLQPCIYIDFNESLPYEKALSLIRKYEGNFEEEVEEFFSGAIIKSIDFFIPDNVYMDIPANRKLRK